MADSIPKLRRLLNEAQERIADLEAQGYGQVIERFVDRVVEVEVPGPERVVEKLVAFKEPVAWYPPSVERVEVVRVEYVDNPELIATIEQLQERIRELQGVDDPDTEVGE